MKTTQLNIDKNKKYYLSPNFMKECNLSIGDSLKFVVKNDNAVEIEFISF